MINSYGLTTMARRQKLRWQRRRLPERSFHLRNVYPRQTPPSAIVIKSQATKQKLHQPRYGVAHRPVNNKLKQGVQEFVFGLGIYIRQAMQDSTGTDNVTH